MQFTDDVWRKLTMLVTALAIPGGLVALCAIVLVVLMARSPRGQVRLRAIGRRVPQRIKTPLVRLMVLMAGERGFPVGPTAVHST
jgi:hypothetical protein